MILIKSYYFENKDDIINDINQNTGSKFILNLPKHNVSNHVHYTEYYDEETYKKIYDMYEEDFLRFGYNK